MKPANLTNPGRWPSTVSVVVMVLFWCALALYTLKSHYGLPKPGSTDVDSEGKPHFNEAKAMEYIRYLSEDIGYRIVGTKAMVESESYVLELLKSLKSDLEASELKNRHQLELWHQVGSGTHMFDFIGKKVWKNYHNITNIIARISDGSEASKANAILVNAHIDSTLPSPGAADDLAGVAVMLEAIRIMTQSTTRLHNAIIFLFNGGEESLQDASHLYITQHETKDSIRAVINLEACGTTGPEILFQATSKEMIEAYSKSPYPYGSVLGAEIFSTGLLLSDTDFRQFEQYGNLTGLDMALVKNSYLYHTRKDLPQYLEPGALTHMAINTLAILRHLALPTTSLTHVEKSASTVYFSFLGGRYFALYSEQTATSLYASLALVFVTYLFFRLRRDHLEAYGVAFVGVAASVVAPVLAANVVAFIMAIVIGRPLTWYRHEYLAVALFSPAALASILLVQHAVSRFICDNELIAKGEDVMEHISLVAITAYSTLWMLSVHYSSILSAYFFAATSFTALLALLVSELFVFKAPDGSRPINLAAIAVGQITPIVMGVDGLVTVLDIFIPLAGRMGPEVHSEHIVATIIGVFAFSMSPMLLPLSHRLGSRFRLRGALILLLFQAAIMASLGQPLWQTYDPLHPKRIYALHMTNITEGHPDAYLTVAAIDRNQDFAGLIANSMSQVGVEAPDLSLSTQSDLMPTWDILYPIGTLLHSMKIQIPLPRSSAEAWRQAFTVRAVESSLNAVKRTRRLTIEMEHPGIIWCVLAFTADIVDWTLPEPPLKGRRRHHIKEVATYGVDRWRIGLTLQLSPDQFEAALRQSQRRKGQRAGQSESDRILAGLRIDYSGLDREGMWPASAKESTGHDGLKFLEAFDNVLPAHVDAMLLSAVAGVAVV